MIAPILITGASGLIGGTLATRLRAAGDATRGIDLRSTDPAERIDIRDRDAVFRAAEGARGIVHLAAVSRVITAEQDPDTCWSVNVTGTGSVLDAAQRSPTCRWVIYASSREVYGEQDALPVAETAPLRPMNVYARSKAAAEDMTYAAARNGGIAAAVLRFSNVFGRVTDYPDRVVPAFARAAADGGTLRIDGADHLFDFTHVDDVVHGIVRTIARLEADGGSLDPVHLVTGTGTTLGELADVAVRLAGSAATVVQAPPRSFDVARFYGDPARAEAVLGWQAETDLASGLADLIARFRALEVDRPQTDGDGS